MEEAILELLDSSESNETESTKALRDQAHQLLMPPTSTTPSQLPTTLEDLLTKTIKPLFSRSHHPSLTSTGRKNLVSAPTIPNRFGTDSIFDPPPPWKNTWTVPLLKWILQSYDNINNTITEPIRQKAIESHFHLLIPPLLHLIDDTEIPCKAQGCDCLTLLCTVLVNVKSDILKRTGLTEVFVDALKNCFHHLPTLTPEDESLLLLQALYPAYLGLIQARFVMVQPYIHPDASTDKKIEKEDDSEITNITATSTPTARTTTASKPLSQSTSTLTPTQISTELTLRTTHLTTLLRHSLLSSMTHLSTQTGTISIPLTTYLLTQLPPLLTQMNISATTHLQSMIPMLTGMIRDPFATAAPDMLDAAVGALEGVIRCCWIRVRDRWWGECLAGLVGGWLNTRDDLGGMDGEGDERGRKLRRLMGRMEMVVGLLGDVVGKAFEEVAARLVEEEPELGGLFRR